MTTFIPEKFQLPALPDLKDVFSIYLAYENDGQSPELQVKKSSEGGKMITNLKNGSYIKFTNINFADGSANGQADMRGILSMNARVASNGGGKIEVRLDDPKGKIAGIMEVPNMKNPKEWFTVSTMIDTNSTDGAYGQHERIPCYLKVIKRKTCLISANLNLATENLHKQK